MNDPVLVVESYGWFNHRAWCSCNEQKFPRRWFVWMAETDAMLHSAIWEHMNEFPVMVKFHKT